MIFIIEISSTEEPPDLVVPSIYELSQFYNSTTSAQAQILMQYIRFLKGLYCSRPFPTYFKSPVTRQHARHFIKLALVDSLSDSEPTHSSVLLQIQGKVDEIQKKKKSLSLDEVGRLTDGSSANYILIEGAPGIGKTTFAWELCQQWAKGQLLNQWPVVLLIQMRDKRIRCAKTLKDIFYHPEAYINDSVYQVMQNTNGKGVLLFFEGYDEVSETQRLEDSVFQKLLRKELLPQAAIAVSSRPIASTTLCEHFTGQVQQHIEILGFAHENVEAYISSACMDNPVLKENFDEYLSCHPFIYSVMYVPLYCSIITELYLMHWNKGKKEFAPKTLTEIYTALVAYLLQRHFDVDPTRSFQAHKIHSLTELPQDMYWSVLDISKIAAKGIQNCQYIFDTLECSPLGLMNAVQDTYIKENPPISFSFLHQTLQEFLAAFYITQSGNLTISQTLQNPDHFPIQKYLQGEHRKESNTLFHWPVLLFIAGLTKLKEIPIELLQSFPMKLKGTPDNPEVKFHPAIFQLLFETQSPLLVSSLFVKNTYMPLPWEMTPLDWFVCGYCIANSSASSTWIIEYEEDTIHTVSCLEMFGRGLRYQIPTKKGGTVARLSLLGGSKLLQCLTAIMDVHARIHGLSELVLGGELNPGRKTDTMLKQIARVFPLLKRLQVSTDLDFTNWHTLFMHLPSLQYLDTLELEAVFTENDATLLSEQLKSCSFLKQLILWCNEDSTGIMVLVASASHLATRHLRVFSLQRCSLNESTVHLLSKAIESPQCSLQVLNFREVNISPNGFSTFAQAIAKKKSITTLGLCDCGITDASVICLATVLNENTMIKDIELTEWYMSEEAEAFLKDAVSNSSTVKNLKLAPRDVFQDIPKELQEYLGLYQ